METRERVPWITLENGGFPNNTHIRIRLEKRGKPVDSDVRLRIAKSTDSDEVRKNGVPIILGNEEVIISVRNGFWDSTEDPNFTKDFQGIADAGYNLLVAKIGDTGITHKFRTEPLRPLQKKLADKPIPESVRPQSAGPTQAQPEGKPDSGRTQPKKSNLTIQFDGHRVFSTDNGKTFNVTVWGCAGEGDSPLADREIIFYREDEVEQACQLKDGPTTQEDGTFAYTFTGFEAKKEACNVQLRVKLRSSTARAKRDVGIPALPTPTPEESKLPELEVHYDPEPDSQGLFTLVVTTRKNDVYAKRDFICTGSPVDLLSQTGALLNEKTYRASKAGRTRIKLRFNPEEHQTTFFVSLIENQTISNEVTLVHTGRRQYELGKV